jgi:E3 ubiquitin-protein ligase MARCH6
VLLWLFAATTGVTFTIGPLLLGRKMLQLVAPSKSPANDLYAFTIGVHAFAAVGYGIAYARLARSYLKAKLQSSGKQILDSVLHVLGLVYLAVFTTLVLPFGLALITELYIHVPIFDMLDMMTRDKQVTVTSTSSNLTASAKPSKRLIPAATVFILQSWAIGLLYLRLLYRIFTHTMDRNSRPVRAIRAITRIGILQADIPLATRSFVLPLTFTCFFLLLFPLSYMRLVIFTLSIKDENQRMRMYRFAYPLFLWMVGNYVGVVFLRRKIEGWRVRIRDEVYLVGERLHNFQEPGKRKARRDKGKGKEREVVAG